MTTRPAAPLLSATPAANVSAHQAPPDAREWSVLEVAQVRGRMWGTARRRGAEWSCSRWAMRC
ncbi:hypothetical protein [Hymenobacter glaciei]|uniref:hypothetical protein n=1 Tax=Hymenobacter glaciei TaxID=877209 RepID=UPI0031ECAEE1